MEPSGKIACPSQSFPITTVIKPVFGWPLLKPSMGGDAEPLSIGPRPEKAKCSGRTYFGKLRNKSSLFVTG
jgi:hypothetical protein